MKNEGQKRFLPSGGRRYESLHQLHQLLQLQLPLCIQLSTVDNSRFGGSGVEQNLSRRSEIPTRARRQWARQMPMTIAGI